MDRINLLKEYQEKMAFAGGMFMQRANKDYVGAMPALTGVLFFKARMHIRLLYGMRSAHASKSTRR
jgi:hypothetical protein